VLIAKVNLKQAYAVSSAAVPAGKYTQAGAETLDNDFPLKLCYMFKEQKNRFPGGY